MFLIARIDLPQDIKKKEEEKMAKLAEAFLGDDFGQFLSLSFV